MKNLKKKRTSSHVEMIQSLERRQMLSTSTPRIRVDMPVLGVSDVRGGEAGRPAQFIIRNVGNRSLVLPAGAFAITGADARQFVILNDPKRQVEILPGQTRNMYIAMNASTDAVLTRLHRATMTIRNNDPRIPVVNTDLRGIAMRSGNGATDEPSLGRVMEAFNIQNNPGDSDYNSTSIDNINRSPDEIYSPRFSKAAAGPVTIQLLGSFAPPDPKAESIVGWYQSGMPDNRTNLLRIDKRDHQTLNPRYDGAVSFDPGNQEFSLFMEQTFFLMTPLSGQDGQKPRLVMGEDAFNTFETRGEFKRKLRVYPMKFGNEILPNRLVVAFEEYGKDLPDNQDIVMILNNVVSAQSGASIATFNMDGTETPRRLVMSRLGQNYTDNSAQFRDTAQFRLTNTGSRDLVINSIQVTQNSGAFSVVSPTGSLTIGRNGTADVTVRFTGSTPGVTTGNLRILSNSRVNPTLDISLAGLWQSVPESDSQGVEKEPVTQDIFSAFGYSTVAIRSGQTFNHGGQPVAVGDEVMLDWLEQADVNAPVFVKQLAGYRAKGSDSRFTWIRYQQKDDFNSVFLASRVDNQTINPRQLNSAKMAQGSFVPSTPRFGIRVDNEYSVDAYNSSPREPSDGSAGHHMRFYPAKDAAGNLLPNQWLMAMDYNGINYDYNDNVYLIQNVRPAGRLAASEAFTGLREGNTVKLDWVNIEFASNYRVYASRNGGVETRILERGKQSFFDFVPSRTGTWTYRVVALDDRNREGTSISFSQVYV
jgi:hypothetical protein